MVIYDSHLHVGVLADCVVIHSNEIKSFVRQYGVKGGLIMPTARVGGDDNLELYDMLYGEALNCGFLIALYLNSGVLKGLKEGDYEVKYPFSAFKIHPEAGAAPRIRPRQGLLPHLSILTCYWWNEKAFADTYRWHCVCSCFEI